MTGGTGDFAGADGVLTMVDTPTGSSVSTSYTGNITIGAHEPGALGLAGAGPLRLAPGTALRAPAPLPGARRG